MKSAPKTLRSLKIPATGYGIRYEFGIFDQLIRDGWQVEITDKWLKGGWPWELTHPDQAVFVGFGGRTEGYTDEHTIYLSGAKAQEISDLFTDGYWTAEVHETSAKEVKRLRNDRERGTEFPDE